MVKSNAANVIDLEAFRQRKREERANEAMATASAAAGGAWMGATGAAQPLVVPVWFCWVPMWSPAFG